MKRKITAVLTAIAASLLLMLGLSAPAQARANTESQYPISVQYEVGTYPDATNTYVLTNVSLTSVETITADFYAGGQYVGTSDVITLAPGESVTVDSPTPRYATLGVFGTANDVGASELVDVYDASGTFTHATLFGTTQAQPYDYVAGSTQRVYNILTGQITSANRVK